MKLARLEFEGFPGRVERLVDPTWEGIERVEQVTQFAMELNAFKIVHGDGA